VWSFSNHYEKGKYVADGKYDPEAVSQQCGTAVIAQTLGAVSVPSPAVIGNDLFEPVKVAPVPTPVQPPTKQNFLIDLWRYLWTSKK
jgi:hypothetical protein